jgi:hypothetical protein
MILLEMKAFPIESPSLDDRSYGICVAKQLQKAVFEFTIQLLPLHTLNGYDDY